MWIYTTDSALINLDYYERVAADPSGTYVYETTNHPHRVVYRLSKYDVMDEIALALREGKNYLEV